MKTALPLVLLLPMPWTAGGQETAPFHEISQAAGINLIGRGRGSAWADINDDGILDLGVCLQQDGFHLYLGRGNLRFEEVTETAGMPPLDTPFGVSMVDVDNDGDADIFITCGGFQWRNPTIPQANRLLLNDGTGRFTEVEDAGGLSVVGYNFSSSWCDVNNDGLLDAFICRVVDNHTKGDNRLFLNRGGARFEDVTQASGVRTGAFSQQALFFQADGDGHPDLFFTNRLAGNAGAPAMIHGGASRTVGVDCPCPAGGCRCGHGPGEGGPPDDHDGAPWTGKCLCPATRIEPGTMAAPAESVDLGNKLFLNQGRGTFADASASSGVAAFQAGFPASAGDIDRDGDLDLFVGTFNFGTHAYFPGYPDRLFRNDGDARFVEIGDEAGIASLGGPMGSAFLDVDNDGWVDLYVARGGPEERRVESDRVYRNLGGGTFVEAARSLGILNKGAGHGMTPADIDADGDLDILVPAGQMAASGLSPTLLFENRGPAGSWLAIDPEGENGNRDAVNAVVIVEDGGRRTVQEILAGSGFGSQPPLLAWFGLGDVEAVDHVTVRWRSGRIREGWNVAARQKVDVLLPRVFDLLAEEMGPVDGETGLTPVRLVWRDARTVKAGAFHVTLQLYAPGEPVILEEDVDGSFMEVHLPPGEYTWSADLRDGLGLVSNSTSARGFTVPSSPDRLKPPAWFASPNPFLTRVQVKGAPDTPAVERFEVRVIDVRGRHVSTLRSDTTGLVSWPGTADDGSPAPPGIYVLRIAVPGHRQIIKVVKIGR